ncbi:glycosyltransferase involved in cell wall biosynthesis [Neolewinella xylanilytica]|uniref:Glycosyltransferase involved in cell wall biosynthesis n=1 Tax=Neolewinella xylanilytica TaxID=1514080 RepID=A0A2S6I7Q0_9BACT|nr:glycosyltransferase family 1 protein [Neolewinella xylanilytica]PPK87527.1 glycosyltransferase involved in cell wall biosynthesis [Neolewinella xylanilytica]
MQLNLFYRKRYPTAFSIERLFDRLALAFESRGLEVNRLELPQYNNRLGAVRQNRDWARAQVQGLSQSVPAINHVTGDVTSIILGMPGPRVITFHDCNPLLRYPKWHPRYWFYRWVIFEWPARKAEAVTVISEKTRRELLELTNCSSDNIHVIPNFVDPMFEHRPKAFHRAYPTLLQVGVKENKNIGRLAAALHGIPCRLDIIGQPGAEDIRQLEDQGIDYHFAAGLTDEEVRQRYVDCDLLVFASTYEGFGIPILEAQMTGRAVVTSNLSPHREVAGAGGAELVDPEDVSSIRAGILRVLNDDAYRNTLINRGLQNAQTYHIDAIAAQYIDLYETIL